MLRGFGMIRDLKYAVIDRMRGQAEIISKEILDERQLSLIATALDMISMVIYGITREELE